MNQTFTFSLSGIFALCVGFVAVSNVVNIIINAFSKAKEPDRKQDEKILELERRMKQFEQFLAKDKEKIESIEEGNRVTQQALLALMSHAINGNDIAKLTDAKDALEKYLINR